MSYDINQGGHGDLLQGSCVKWRPSVAALGRYAL
jgi:hypothetical protein